MDHDHTRFADNIGGAPWGGLLLLLASFALEARKKGEQLYAVYSPERAVLVVAASS
jgi:hypothetical protein